MADDAIRQMAMSICHFTVVQQCRDETRAASEYLFQMHSFARPSDARRPVSHIVKQMEQTYSYIYI